MRRQAKVEALPRRRRDAGGWLMVLGGMLASITAAGCSQEPASTHGDVVGDSLNGVSALVQMLRDQGHPVTARPEISAAAFRERDAAIVFVDGDGPIEDAAAARLESFLEEPGPQSLFLVGRDGDWGVDYWRVVADAVDLPEAKRQRARDKGRDAARDLAAWYGDVEATTAIVPFAEARLVVRGEERGEAEVDVSIHPEDSTGSSVVLHGAWPWRRGVEPGDADEVAWEIDGEAFLVRSIRDVEGDTVVVMGSDMPLLNAGLVDPGNRRIAEAFVGLIPAGAGVVVFGSSQMATGEEDDGVEGGLWRLISVPPHPWIVAQLVLCLALFCWSRASIFGRPRTPSAAALRDFGHHVDAVGRLLSRSNNPAASDVLLAEWQRVGKPGFGPGAHEQMVTGKDELQPEARKR